MRTALAVGLLLVGSACGARRNQQSLVLQGGVSDESGPSGVPDCQLEVGPEVEVRLERNTVWIGERSWAVDTEVGEEAFEKTLYWCGATQLQPAFRAWRAAEARAETGRRRAGPDPASTIGTTLLAGAATVAVTADAAPGADADALSHAMRDENLKPATSPVATPVPPELDAARQVLIDGIGELLRKPR